MPTNQHQYRVLTDWQGNYAVAWKKQFILLNGTMKSAVMANNSDCLVLLSEMSGTPDPLTKHFLSALFNTIQYDL